MTEAAAPGDGGGGRAVAPNVSVSLSGGGHRASLFALGALSYLVDAERAAVVGSIASVSGGSLTNAVVAERMNFREASDGPQFLAAMKPFAQRLAHEGTVQWAPAVRRWMVRRAGMAVAAGVGSAIVAPRRTRVATAAGVTFALAGVAAGQRSVVAADAFNELLFTSDGGPAFRLSDLAKRTAAGIDHVFCATDLQSFEHVYFTPTFIYGYRFGTGSPAELRLADVVQASAALPGAFPPRWLPTAPHGFRGAQGRPDDDSGEWMVLCDGGVYDNMGDQWASGLGERLERWNAAAVADRPSPLPVPIDELIVVNASAGLGWRPMTGRDRIPVLGELLALNRDKDLLYDTSTSLRRQELAGRFDRAILTGRGVRGALVHIPQSPFDVARHYQKHPTGSDLHPQRHARSLAVLDALGDTETQWQARTAASMKVPTTLAAIGASASVDLVWHGYTLTMANLHVLLDYPLLSVPDRERFEELVAR